MKQTLAYIVHKVNIHDCELERERERERGREEMAGNLWDLWINNYLFFYWD